MRRGTPSAKKFGEYILLLRLASGLTMREVGRRVGAPAATVSQVEKGQRALKEPKIPIWATALEVSETYLRQLWVQADSLPAPAIVRKRASSVKTKELEDIISKLNGVERERVLGYITAIIEDRE